MRFWEIAFGRGWVTKDQLKMFVITTDNQRGEITKTEYKTITGEDFVE